MSEYQLKRALLSVSDKTGIVELAKGLVKLGIEIISTGGTYNLLHQHQLPVTYISEVTHFPEMLAGRVKTLHPAIHGAILARRNNDDDMQAIENEKIKPIDLVVINLYPFERVARQPNVSREALIENIDIGGPAMIRSAAKNHDHVIVVVDPNDYVLLLDKLNKSSELDAFRIEMALKAFQTTAKYDSAITNTLQQQYSKSCAKATDSCMLEMKKVMDLRYGENPAQSAALYRLSANTSSFIDANQLQGKALSYNNWLDSDSAFRLLQEFSEPCAVIVKHTNPCGVAVSDTIETAFTKAHEADPLSAFGGIVAINRPVTEELAQKLLLSFWEVIIAPYFTEDALTLLANKPNLRLLAVPHDVWAIRPTSEWRTINGGFLVQDSDIDVSTPETWQCVTEKKESELNDYVFAWKVVKHVKSNAIVVAYKGVTVGIGAGQMNRVGAVRIALEQASKQHKAQSAVLASDAFFPFSDSVELAAKYGIRGIVQPGGSIKDQESIDAANKESLVMLFTGQRHFRH